MLELYLNIAKLIRKYSRNTGIKIARLQSDVHVMRADIRFLKFSIKNIERKEDQIMAKLSDEMELIRVALNDATNAVADRIDNLKDQIKNSMSDEEVATLKEQMHNQVDRLHQLAASASDPVPGTEIPSEV